MTGDVVVKFQANDVVFCGRILMFLAHVFPLSERSGKIEKAMKMVELPIRKVCVCICIDKIWIYLYSCKYKGDIQHIK